MNTLFGIGGVLLGGCIGFYCGVHVPTNIDGVQRDSLKKTFSIPTPATVDTWKGVKLVRWCEKGSFGVYELSGGEFKAADPKWGPAGVVVADPEKVC